MTNWCTNRLTISGSHEDVDAFAKNCLCGASSNLDFEKILPMPPILRGLYRRIPSKLGNLSAGFAGMETLRRAPVPLSDDPAPTRSILNHAQVKAKGLKNYDELERWLHANDPESLELGRKSLIALEATGFAFEDDWVGMKWGCDPQRMDYDERTLSEAGYFASFASAWSAPEGIIREIAGRHPALTVRFTAVEEGNAYVFLLNAENGQVNEEWPPLTDALIEEVGGAGEIERHFESEAAFYRQPATLERRPARHVRYWWSEWRFRLALVGYPVYEPPHRGIEMMMPANDAAENYQFFLAHKESRIEGLRRFLKPFGVPLEFSDRTKAALDRWLVTHAAFLYARERGCSFLTHSPAWSGARLRLNIIFDLALFLGDFAIHESPALRWEMDVQTQPGRTRDDHEFQRPVIAAATPLFSFPRDVIYGMYQFCYSQCEASYISERARFRYGSRPLARQFVTKTLRHIALSARNDFETANREWCEDSFRR